MLGRGEVQLSDNQYYYCSRCGDVCFRCDCKRGGKREDGKVVNSPSNTNTFNPIFNPSITINIPSGKTPSDHIGVETFQYLALAEEGKTTYTNEDALKQYGSSDILDPNHVSMVNLFVNGVLQPPSVYHMEEGMLTLTSSDLPPKGAPIIILFVIIKEWCLTVANLPLRTGYMLVFHHHLTIDQPIIISIHKIWRGYS